MLLKDSEVLERPEAVLAQALMKVKLVPEQAIQDYITFAKENHQSGKPYLGKVLLNMKYITQADLDEYVNENDAAHAEFMESLLKGGYLTNEQRNMLFEEKNKTGNDLITLINELGIMTKENYMRIFNNRVYVLKLGEWLVMKKKVTEEQLGVALKVRNISTLEEYLLHHNSITKPMLDKIKEKLAGISG
jgi:hypothetical protein